MEKMFAEVFPPLHVDKGIAELLEQVRVERVTSNRAKTHIKVYLVSKKLIHREQLFQVERVLKNFPDNIRPRKFWNFTETAFCLN